MSDITRLHEIARARGSNYQVAQWPVPSSNDWVLTFEWYDNDGWPIDGMCVPARSRAEVRSIIRTVYRIAQVVTP